MPFCAGFFALYACILLTKRSDSEQMHQMAFNDVLTGLPNRRLFTDRLSQAMTAATRSGCFGALMPLDLDNFKSLNDTYGTTSAICC